ncbi:MULTISPECIES: FAD-binding oxidoreductase [Streptomyces]|uniref:Mitomycin radical oxidase n=1 Tax=Streptomyces chartreusis NRRL 3882 TaxID=1079985 RepID=A0A2N9BJS0_STRCX|nr:MULTISPECIES: FAD-binding oxidoreductase [Streptomyces]MYS90500.1 FAD-binding protein [Streptomyces sp. SID5464]SOR83583.1 Mitomycin radical oxidase [Streptomyces chartreusis NRRL 3882]
MTLTDPAAVLRQGFTGQVLRRGEPGYDEARQVFNAMMDRRPAIVARCATTADVVAAVDVARDHGLVVAVRCGGHSVAGLGTCDDGMLIDLSGLKSITVDPGARTARAGGGVLWGELDTATQAHGLHTPGGRVSTTGIGGFTTGGGYGWTSCKYGLACDNLISAEVVLADGRVVRAGEREHADLFWGLRGGGGNFGIVTEFEFRLHPLGPTVLAGLTMFPVERAPEVLRGWRDCADAAPDELATALVVLTAPPEPFVPARLRGEPVLGVAALYVGAADRGDDVVQPLRDLRPAVDHIAPMPYTAFQAALDPLAPRGFRSYWRGEYLRELTDDAIDTFLSHAVELTSLGAPLSEMVIFRVGQGVAAVPDAATAFSHRDAGYLFHPICMWDDPSDDSRMITAGRAFASAMRPFGTGAAYLNFTPEADRVRDAYTDETYARLVAIKDTYDPANLFRLNQNIRPSHSALVG